MSCLRSSRHPSLGTTSRFVSAVLLFTMFFPIAAHDVAAKTKHKNTPVREPDLKILNLTIAPIPYLPKQGPLDFTVVVQLPKEVDSSLVLEVSSLVTSASMTSLRFLSSRQPVADHQSGTIIAGSAVNGEPEPKRVRIHLNWDGLDHNKQPAPPGSYEYVVRAKLLSNGEKGQKTQMSSWPKRGVFAVK